MIEPLQCGTTTDDVVPVAVVETFEFGVLQAVGYEGIQRSAAACARRGKLLYRKANQKVWVHGQSVAYGA